MGKKQISFKPKGMNKDLSASAFNPEFVFDNRNLRLSTNEGNTMLSWVNERGTEQLKLIIDGITNATIQGTPVGTATINKKLVVFTAGNTTPKKDRIYLFDFEKNSSNTIEGKTLYEGDLGFSAKYPLETLAYWEAANLEKVYWVDGITPVRVINVAADEATRERWKKAVTPFDFFTGFKPGAKVTINKTFDNTGNFLAGVIQYAFTYFNKYGQESNIFYQSPLYYISPNGRGGAPNEMCDCAFTIDIEDVDTSFEYVRVYSIIRTALDATPEVKHILDFPITESIHEEQIINELTYSTDPTDINIRENSQVTLYLEDKESKSKKTIEISGEAIYKTEGFVESLNAIMGGEGQEADYELTKIDTGIEGIYLKDNTYTSEYGNESWPTEPILIEDNPIPEFKGNILTETKGTKFYGPYYLPYFSAYIKTETEAQEDGTEITTSTLEPEQYSDNSIYTKEEQELVEININGFFSAGENISSDSNNYKPFIYYIKKSSEYLVSNRAKYNNDAEIRIGNTSGSYDKKEYINYTTIDSDIKWPSFLTLVFNYNLNTDSFVFDYAEIKGVKVKIESYPAQNGGWLNSSIYIPAGYTRIIVQYDIDLNEIIEGYKRNTDKVIFPKEDNEWLGPYNNWMFIIETPNDYDRDSIKLEGHTIVKRIADLEEIKKENADSTQWYKLNELASLNYDVEFYAGGDISGNNDILRLSTESYNTTGLGFFYLYAGVRERTNPNCIPKGGYFLESITISREEKIPNKDENTSDVVKIDATNLSTFAQWDASPVPLKLWKNNQRVIFGSGNYETYSKSNDYLAIRQNHRGEYEYLHTYYKITKNNIQIIDDNLRGETIDAQSLLYLNESIPITANTIAAFQDSLFLGRIKEEATIDIVNKLKEKTISVSNSQTNLYQYLKDVLVNKLEIGSVGGNSTDFGAISLQKNCYDTTTFKYKETYRLGIQLQDNKGRWSNIIHLADKTIDDEFIKTSQSYSWSSINHIFNIEDFDLKQSDEYRSEQRKLSKYLYDEGYRAIRPVVVHPRMQERVSIFQGIACPTVFNLGSRIQKGIFAQASWFCRPNLPVPVDDEYTLVLGGRNKYGPLRKSGGGHPEYLTDFSLNKFTYPEFRHWAKIKDIDCNNAEIQSLWANVGAFYTVRNTISEGNDLVSIIGDNNERSWQNFYIDRSIITVHSPDVEWGSLIEDSNLTNNELKIVGYVPLNSSSTYMTIQVNQTQQLKASVQEYLGEDDNAGTLWSNAVQYTNVLGEGLKKNVWTNSSDGEIPIAIPCWSDYNYRGFGKVTTTNDTTIYYTWDEEKKKQIKHTTTSNVTHLTSVPYTYIIYPWHKAGSIVGDTTDGEKSSVLKSKITTYLLKGNVVCYQDKEVPLELYDCKYFKGINDSGSLYIKYLGKQQLYSGHIDQLIGFDIRRKNRFINFFKNKDIWAATGYPISLMNYNGESKDDLKDNNSSLLYYEYDKNTTQGAWTHTQLTTEAVNIAYKSGPHAVISLGNASHINILPLLDGQGTFLNYGVHAWGDENTKYDLTPWVVLTGKPGIDNHLLSQDYINTDKNFLWLVEFSRKPESIQNIFGGDDETAYSYNEWMVAGEPLILPTEDDYKAHPTEGLFKLEWCYGDTYIQRYDALRTEPYSTTSINQMVEIVSFPCATTWNIDGVYNQNRNMVNNIGVHSGNFNQLNTVYSQKNNFLRPHYMLTDTPDTHNNQVLYSLTKTNGEEVDSWTKIVGTSSVDLNGSFGAVNMIRQFGDTLYVFQDTGISTILYNVSTPMTSTEGVPIEIANSGKVEGIRYLYTNIGCTNKWSSTITTNGIYFMDSYNKCIYLLGKDSIQSLQDISTAGGFSAWSHQKIPMTVWNVADFEGFVTYYDAQNQDVLFISKDTCLAYSEKFNVFTSFYDYQNTPFFNSVEGMGIWIAQDRSKEDSQYYLYKHQTGEYNKIFEQNYSYSMTLVGNQDPQIDKTFTNLEFRAGVTGDGVLNANKFTPLLPFDYLEVWDEYQHGYTNLKNITGHQAMVHPNEGDSALKRKFRIWRCDIPRDNYPLAKTDAEKAEEASKGIFRHTRKINDRIRNPWVYIKLQKDAKDTMPKTEIHDVVLTYFV